MARRAAALKLQRTEDSDLLLLSAGGFYGRSGIIEMYRSRFLAEMMLRMDYSAVAVGERELGYGLRAIRADAEAGLPVICANLYYEGERVFPPAVVKKVHGRKVGILALLGGTQGERGDVDIEDPVSEGLQVLEGLKEQGCDVVVLLANMHTEELVSVLPLLKGVDLAIRGNVERGGRASDDCADTLGGVFEDIGIPLLYAGDRGRAIGKVKVISEGRGKNVVLGAELIYLDKSVGEDEEAASMLGEFTRDESLRLRELRLSEFLSRDEITGQIRERYLGIDVCERCHAPLMPDFVSSRHFRAFETLRIHGKEGDPECLQCHTTGYGRFSGYSPESEKKGGIYLSGVQCEACHGPGTRHSRDGDYIESARISCRQCHTPRWSPDFDFKEYWARAGHCPSADSTETEGAD